MLIFYKLLLTINHKIHEVVPVCYFIYCRGRSHKVILVPAYSFSHQCMDCISWKDIISRENVTNSQRSKPLNHCRSRCHYLFIQSYNTVRKIFASFIFQWGINRFIILIDSKYFILSSVSTCFIYPNIIISHLNCYSLVRWLFLQTFNEYKQSWCRKRHWYFGKSWLYQRILEVYPQTSYRHQKSIKKKCQ